MKFRPHDTLFAYGIIGFPILVLGLLFSVYVAVQPGCGFVFIIVIIGVLSIWGAWKNRDMFFAKIQLTKQGIISECIFKKPSLLSWDNVKDCGIINATTSPVDRIYCIYFSPEKLTINQKQGIIGSNENKNGVMSKIVKIPLCLDAINEIEKNAPERVLDMLKDDVVYPYDEIVAELRRKAEKKHK